jgi:hypothetical protein
VIAQGRREDAARERAQLLDARTKRHCEALALQHQSQSSCSIAVHARAPLSFGIIGQPSAST